MNENNDIINGYEKNQNLESKIWFRFLRVVFIFIYLLCFYVVLVSAYNSKPYTVIDSYNSLIVCDNGTRYKAGKNNIDGKEAWAGQLITTEQDYMTDQQLNEYEAKIQATHLCQSESVFIPDDPPYRVELVRETVGNWWSFIGYTVLALFTVVVIFELIKRSFFYIVIGKRFLK